MCITCSIQVLQILKIFFEIGDEIEEKEILIKKICQEISSMFRIFVNIFNFFGILTLIIGGIVLSNPNTNHKTVGIISIIVGSLYLLNMVVSCIILIYVSCCGFVVSSLSKSRNDEEFNYGGEMGENEFD